MTEQQFLESQDFFVQARKNISHAIIFFAPESSFNKEIFGELE
jgi:hypothetical protein